MKKIYYKYIWLSLMLLLLFLITKNLVFTKRYVCAENFGECTSGAEFFGLDFFVFGVGIERLASDKSWLNFVVQDSPGFTAKNFYPQKIYYSKDIRSSNTKQQQQRWKDYLNLRNNILKSNEAFEDWLIDGDYSLLKEKASGSNLLHFAVYNNNTKNLKWLIDFGLVVNTQNAREEIPLHNAVRAGNTEAVEVLRAAGADPKLKNFKGESVLDLCKNSTDYIKIACKSFN